MKSICIIGGGEAGIHFIKELRLSGNNCKIVLIDKRNLYFERKKLFNCWIPKGECKITHFNNEFNAGYYIEYIKATVERVNPNTRKVFFKDHPSIEFDTLIIASGVVSKNLSIKGDFREGFSYLSDIDPLDSRDYLNISKDVVVYTSTILGLRLSLFLSSIEKEVKFIAGDLDFLGSYKQRFLDLLEEKNIGVYLNCCVEEAIGEARVKAARVSLPKVFSSQVIFVDSGFNVNRGFFDAELQIKDRFFTNYEEIYVLGEAANENIDKESFFIHNAEETREQARLLADYITHNNMPDNHSYDGVFHAREEFLEKILQQDSRLSA